MSKTVLCFGEALIDFLNVGVQQDDILALNQFTQFPGGAPANAAVAVAKLGGKAKFAGQVGDDPFGHFLQQALVSYGVDTQFTHVHANAKTPLAFVFLDEQGERSFAFHRENTADMVFSQEQVDDIWFAQQPILHFCSNTLTAQPIADVTQFIVHKAVRQNSLISFDVNLRHNLWPSLSADKDLVNKFVMQSHLVKFAKEELEYLAGGNLTDSRTDSYLAKCFSNGVKAIIITDGGNPIVIHTANKQLVVEPPVTNVVDTTGGGDAFIGAVLFGFSQSDSQPIDDGEFLRKLVSFASHCGAIAVSKQGAFPAFPGFDDVKEHYVRFFE